MIQVFYYGTYGINQCTIKSFLGKVAFAIAYNLQRLANRVFRAKQAMGQSLCNHTFIGCIKSRQSVASHQREVEEPEEIEEPEAVADADAKADEAEAVEEPETEEA